MSGSITNPSLSKRCRSSGPNGIFAAVRAISALTDARGQPASAAPGPRRIYTRSSIYIITPRGRIRVYVGIRATSVQVPRLRNIRS
jgi:hypothetical protein